MTDVVFEASGMLYDKLSRTSRPVYMRMKGHAIPVDPPDAGGPPGIWPGPGDPDFPGGGKPPGGGSPPGIWPGPGDPDYPGGGGKPPGIWGPTDPRPTPPIYIPPNVPPGMQPPEAPPPGSPTTPVPPPEGSGGWPVAPIVPPPYIVVHYPGIGPVTVAQPAAPAAPTS